MSMLKVQFNILKYDQSEGSRDYYIHIFHYVHLRTDGIKSLGTFSCDIFTDTDVHILFHRIRTHPQMFLQYKYIYDRVKEYLL